MKENKGCTPAKKVTKTPMKFTSGSSVSVSADVPYQLVATPVRRSMRPRASNRLSRLDEQVVYVDDLEQLSPTLKSRAIIRQNAALAPSPKTSPN